MRDIFASSNISINISVIYVTQDESFRRTDSSYGKELFSLQNIKLIAVCVKVDIYILYVYIYTYI